MLYSHESIIANWKWCRLETLCTVPRTKQKRLKRQNPCREYEALCNEKINNSDIFSFSVVVWVWRFHVNVYTLRLCSFIEFMRLYKRRKIKRVKISERRHAFGKSSWHIWSPLNGPRSDWIFLNSECCFMKKHKTK